MAEKFRRMNITEEENSSVVVEDGENCDSGPQWALARKVLYNRTLHIDTISGSLRPAWGNPKGLEFSSIGDNMFIVTLESGRERDRIWNGSPWMVGKHGVALKNFEINSRPSDIVFDKMLLWVRVLNLPFNLRRPPWVDRIATKVGDVVKKDADEKGIAVGADLWSHSEYDELVNKNWQRGADQNRLQGVVSALKEMQNTLSTWGAREFGSLRQKVRKLQKNLERLRTSSVGRGPCVEELSVAAKLKEALRQEEVWMKQRSRVQWLKAGDRNTAYFHARAAQRRSINRITSLKSTEDDHMCEQPEEVHAEIQSFYTSLYDSEGYSEIGDLLNVVNPRVTTQMNATISKSFEAEEIKTALFQMAASKAQGVDGFTAGFFQRHWEVLKDDLVPAVLDFLNGGELPKGMNDTAITLIPK
ncbi:hypothetical protein ACQ4PT_002847 [Festuca glaucescens]